MQNYDACDKLKVMPFRLVTIAGIKFTVGDGRIDEHSDRIFFTRTLQFMNDFHMCHSAFAHLHSITTDLRLDQSAKTESIGSYAEWNALEQEYQRIRALQRKVFNEPFLDTDVDKFFAMSKLREQHAKEASYIAVVAKSLIPIRKPNSIKFDESQFRCHKRWKPSKYGDTMESKCRKKFDAGLNRMLQLLVLPMASYSIETNTGESMCIIVNVE